MIKVITGYKVSRGEDIRPILLKLGSHAMQYPGFMGAENLLSEKDSSIIVMVGTWEKAENWRVWERSTIGQDLSEKDSSIIVMVGTWEKAENWRVWERSTIGQDLLQQAETFLAEEPRVTIYRVMPARIWA